MTTHAEGSAFYQHRSRILSDVLGEQMNGVVYFEDIIPIDANGLDAISDPFVGKTFAPELFIAGGGQSIPVIFNDERSQTAATLTAS
jgi:hypothetical protein